MLPRPIDPDQTDAKSPVDDNLMDSIRENLDYLDTQSSIGANAAFNWNINGPLALIPAAGAKRIDLQLLNETQAFQKVRLAQEFSGASGVTEIDIRYHSTPKTPILSILPKFSGSTQSIAKVGTALNTQSIARASAQISTQSISRVKSQLNITSVIKIPGTNLWRYNLSSAPDADYAPGKHVLFDGCTSSSNDGIHEIVEINQAGFPCIVVVGISNVAQTGASGTADLQLFSLNFVNPVDSMYTLGSSITGASHTNAVWNTTLVVYRYNFGGNNIHIYLQNGVAQAGVAGNVNTTLWTYSYSSPVTSDYVVGELAVGASHTSGNNNGNLIVVGVNVGGNNLIVLNPTGAAQGGAAGNIATLRFSYVYLSDPLSSVSVGDSVVLSGHTSGDNNGTFVVKDINVAAGLNLVFYNPVGATQAGVAGSLSTYKKVVKFGTDQSANITTDSYLEIQGSPISVMNMKTELAPYKVLEVNFGGGLNYNAVVSDPTVLQQLSPVGYVAIEAKSIFTAADGSKPQLAADVVGTTELGKLLKAEYSGSDISTTPVPAMTYVALYVLRKQGTGAKNLSVSIS